MTRTWGVIVAGVLIGLVALILGVQGNPPNMGVCVACFLRDTAGGLQLQTAPPVQYMRPEIFGFAIGAFVIALLTKSFTPRSGSAPFVRFFLGFLMMVGCLVFLGCPLRVFLRIAGGDLNAVVGLVGLVAGIAIGTVFLNKEFALPRQQNQPGAEGLVFPLVCIAILLLMVVNAGLFALSTKGPASMHAPFLYALIGGALIGILVQQTKFCSIGFISHAILFKRFYMLFGVIGLIAVVMAGNLYYGTFKLGFDNQPIAHTDGIWNFLSMALVGLCGVFLSGCPLRQIVKAGHGDSDAAVTVLGMLVGAAIAHNFSLASSAAGATSGGKIFVILGLISVFVIGLFFCRKALSESLREAVVTD